MNNTSELWQFTFIQDDLGENCQGLPFHFSLRLTHILLQVRTQVGSTWCGERSITFSVLVWSCCWIHRLDAPCWRTCRKSPLQIVLCCKFMTRIFGSSYSQPAGLP